MKKILWIFLCVLLLSTVAALDYWHGDTCGRPEGVAAKPKLLDKPMFGLRKTVEQGSRAEFRVEVENQGQSGYVVCEVGIYYEAEVNNWYGGSLFNVGKWDSLTGNCVEGENFVITKNVYMSGGEKEIWEYSVHVPHTYDNDDRFVAHVGCFNHCYLCGHHDYINYGFDTMPLKLIGRDDPPEDHCKNFKTDSDETSMDCGGDDCEPCVEGQRCKKDSDCNTNICSSSFLCEDSRDPVVPPGDEETKLDWTMIGIAGAVVILLLLLFAVILKN